MELARAVAVLDGDAELRHAVALAGLPLSAGEGAADELTLARLLRPGRPLRFAHPLLRAAVEAELPSARLAAAHRLAGALLDAEPALADRAAAHLLACEPAGDTWVAHKLQAAGERATARGAPEAAVRLLERARREPCDEPALQLALGRAYRLVGRLGEASAVLELALAAWPLGPERDEITRDLATALAMNARGEEAVALLERELDGLPPGAGERRVLLATQLGLGMLLDALVVDASARVEREAAGLSGDTAAERLLLGSLALIRGRTGTKGAAAAAEAAERALEAGGLRHDEAPGTLVRVFVSLVLLAADRDEDAERWLERLAAVAREDGAEMTLGIAELGLGRVWRFRGALAPARAAVERSLERALIGSSYGRVVAGGTLAALLVDCGELDAADRSLGELGLDTGPLPGLGAATTLLRGRMALHSARRRHAEACADADDVLERLERRRHRAPGPLGEAAMAYLAAGEAERARGAAEEELERARRWGTPSALGIAELQLGLATGDEARLERAAVTLADDAVPARAREGAARARGGPPAGEPALRGTRAAAPGARSRRALWRRAGRGGRPHRARCLRRAPAPRAPHRPRQPDGERAARRRARGPGPLQPGGRPRARGLALHGRESPQGDLPQARRGLARGARGGAPRKFTEGRGCEPAPPPEEGCGHDDHRARDPPRPGRPRLRSPHALRGVPGDGRRARRAGRAAHARRRRRASRGPSYADRVRDDRRAARRRSASARATPSGCCSPCARRWRGSTPRRCTSAPPVSRSTSPARRRRTRTCSTTPTCACSSRSGASPGSRPACAAHVRSSSTWSSIDGDAPGVIALGELAPAPGFDLERAGAAVGPDDRLTLMYTSGTTGAPKGVVYDHRAVLAAFAGFDSAVPATDWLHAVAFIPFAHAGQRAFGHYRSLLHGSTTTFCPDPDGAAVRDRRRAADRAVRPARDLAAARGGRARRAGGRPRRPGGARPRARVSAAWGGRRRRRRSSPRCARGSASTGSRSRS